MEWLRKVVLDPRTERFIMTVIILNAVVLGLETSKTIMESYGRVLEILDHIMLAIFVVELTARIAVHRLAFFRDPWSVFDFIVVAIALVPTTETFSVNQLDSADNNTQRYKPQPATTGVTLNVKPIHVGESYVTLDVEPTVLGIAGLASRAGSTLSPIATKRTAKTTVSA